MVRALICLIAVVCLTCGADAQSLSCKKARSVANKVCSAQVKNKARCSRAKKISKQLCSQQNNPTKDSTIVCATVVIPVCAQPPMSACPKGKVCAAVMPQPRIYSNACFAKADGAVVVSDSYCSGSIG